MGTSALEIPPMRLAVPPAKITACTRGAKSGLAEAGPATATGLAVAAGQVAELAANGDKEAGPDNV